MSKDQSPTLGLALDRAGATSRNVTVDVRKFFASVGKATVKLATGAYADAASEVPEIATALGLTSSPQDRGTTLILGALQRALSALIAPLTDSSHLTSIDINAVRFSGLSDDFQLDIDAAFFARPEQSQVVDAVSKEAIRWLLLLDMAQADADNVVHRLRFVIAKALHDEWRSNPEYYAQIVASTDTPFLTAAIFEQDWDQYRTYLVGLQGEQVFEESFSLGQIYVEPRCYHTAHINSEGESTGFGMGARGHGEPVRIVKILGEEIAAWLGSPDPELSTRVIAGGPGAGKSSYAKLLSSRMAQEGRDVLFIPLHQIDLEIGIASAINQFMKEAGHFSTNPLDRLVDGRILILILDGLDEIQMQGRAAQDAAHGMVNDLLRWIDRINSVSLRVKCILTGRELAVQSAESLFKAEGQVLHILPYFLTEEERRNYVDTSGLLSSDQRDDWWKRYGSLTGLSYAGIPDNLKQGEIGDVTSQPLLNYLVALAYRRGLSIEKETNVNTVYEDLLNAVYARSWAKHSHTSIQDVPYDSFVRLLEEVSISVWHGAGRTATLSEVEEHCRQSKVGSLLKSLEQSSSGGVSSLLLAFYFRQKGRRSSGEKTFEFTHKTFAEYLTSLGVVRAIESIGRQLHAYYEDSDQGIDEETALHKWLVLCGKTPIDNYLNDFVRREVKLRGKLVCTEWQASLSKMLSASMRVGWPIHRIEGLKFAEQTKRVRNAEEALVACINACSRVAEQYAPIRWVSDNSFGSMLKRLQGQRSGPQNVLAMSCLSYLKLDGQFLDIADLYHCDLSNCSFVGSELNFATLYHANLSFSDFTGAALTGCNIASANLNGTRLPAHQLFELRQKRSYERVVENDEASRISMSQRTFVLAVRRYTDRGAILLDGYGGFVDQSNAEEFFRERRNEYVPAGRRHLDMQGEEVQISES